MDQELLVKSGHKLIELLTASGMTIRGAMWVHNPDTNIWRLWLVPDKSIKDKREFYRRVAEVITANRIAVSGVDVSDTEYVKEDHPAIVALRRFAKVTSGGSVHLSNNQFNGFYLPEGIILQMDF